MTNYRHGDWITRSLTSTRNRTRPGGRASRGSAEAIARVAAVAQERLDAPQAALDRLDPIDREVLALRHFEELSNNEVAALLGIRKAAASKRYVRALERLKSALAEIPGFFEDHA